MEKYRRLFNPLFILFTGVILVSLFLHRCTFKSPSAPVWDVGFIIPLISEKYTMEKLADESDNIEIQGNQVLFNIDHELDPIEIGDYLKTNGAEKMTHIPLPNNAPDPFENMVNDILTIPDSIVVNNAVIKSGQVQVTINNQTDYGVRIDISIPSLNQNGSELPITLDISPGGYLNWFLPLDLVEFNAGGTNQIAYSAKATITWRTGNQGGNVEVNVNISDIFFQEITGTLNRVHLGLEDQSMEINLPDELEGFRIHSANLKLALRVGVQIPIIADLIIEAINPRNPGFPTLISFQDSITNVTGDGVMVDTLEFTNDLEVAGFINGQPEEIVVNGSLKIGDGQSTVTVVDTNTIKAKVLFKAPLTVTLPDYITETDPDTIEIDEDARERLRDNLMSVDLEVMIDNHLPLGASVSVFFDSTASDSATLYSPSYTPNLTIGPLQLDPAPVAGIPGLVTGPASSTLSIDLDKEQLELFERPEIFFGTRLQILGTAGQMVQVRPTDYIDITARLNAVVRTKIPENEEEEEGGGE
ncbi:hypothetical protein JW824_08135 [bacterium]|nr:hypothetical protein [bacterium]